MEVISQIETARTLLNQGGILAYPTEGVYGLGCDPFCKRAVERLLALKHRCVSKGLIVLIADWTQLAALVKPLTADQWLKIRETWPGPVTWIFPKAPEIPVWLTGAHDGIAIRMSAHPLLQALCKEGPVVSTSANRSGYQPIMTMADIQAQFANDIDGLLLGELGGAGKVSAIFDLITDVQLR